MRRTTYRRPFAAALLVASVLAPMTATPAAAVHAPGATQRPSARRAPTGTARTTVPGTVSAPS